MEKDYIWFLFTAYMLLANLILSLVNIWVKYIFSPSNFSEFLELVYF